MPANIDSMLYVKEIPWHGLGHRYEEAPKTSKEIIEGAKLDWEVDTAIMKTDLHDQVFNYHAVYRKDSSRVLGVINKPVPTPIQNIDMFNSLSELMSRNDIITDTAASIDGGRTVFGCFKIPEKFKVLDDDIQHYFVVVNDHLKCDGKITVINTPIRIVCENTLNAALSSTAAKIRIPVSNDPQVNESLALRILGSASNAITALDKKAQKLIADKVSKAYVDKLLEELFPYIEVKEGDTSTHDRANERIDMMRSTFITDCLASDNLANYSGTKYQVLNAITDFAQHYYLDADKSYDLGYRMGAVFGSSDSSQPIGLTNRFMKIIDKIAA